MSMPWINTHFISGTKDDVGELYGIKSIPKNILFDTEGKIVAIDIKGEKLEKFLHEKL